MVSSVSFLRKDFSEVSIPYKVGILSNDQVIKNKTLCFCFDTYSLKQVSIPYKVGIPSNDQKENLIFSAFHLF